LPAIYGIPQKTTTPPEEEEAASPTEEVSNAEETQPASEQSAQPANVGADKAVDEQGAAEETES
jgi:hypothetical protein